MIEKMNKVSNFVVFLSGRDHSLQEILDHLVRVVLVCLDTDTIAFFQVNQYSEIRIAGKSRGSKLIEDELEHAYNLNDNFPIADAIRFGEIVWMENLLESKSTYPSLANFPNLLEQKLGIIIPIFLSSTPIGALALTSRVTYQSTIECEVFLKAIGHIFSMYVYRNVLSSPDEPDDLEPKNRAAVAFSSGYGLELTERQLVILRLISEERTNLSISQFLGYSESTIRQEIMRIFVKLGCTSRSEAAKIYREYITNS